MIVGVAQVHMHGSRELADVVSASDAARVLFRLSEGGQEEGRKNGDDRDNDQQFDQCESGASNVPFSNGRGRMSSGT